jgi:hypothetical protein
MSLAEKGQAIKRWGLRRAEQIRHGDPTVADSTAKNQNYQLRY